MEVLKPIRQFCGVGFPVSISRIHTAYIGEYLHLRYLKCLVKTWPEVWFLKCFEMNTLPKTNITRENRPSQKETSIPTIHFQGLR